MRVSPGPRLDHAVGDLTAARFPSHPAALHVDGAAGLTRLFRASGAIGPEQAVARIVSAEPCPGGSTGAKLLLRIAWARPGSGLPDDLFVKFSRDFEDDRRDLQRDEMEGEARFARIADDPGFPVATPRALFADYHGDSGTGLLVTERIRFGEDGIEPHRAKCRDHATLADPLPHYLAILSALARLAGTDRGGRLDPAVDRWFPFDPATGSSDPIRADAATLAAELAGGAAFARDCPRLLPGGLRDPAFQHRLAADATLVRRHEAALQRVLTGNPDLIALCHWNAQIDNAWFRTDASGTLTCGLLDWGRVGRMTLGSALWGALSAAPLALWTDHLGTLLGRFARDYAAAGGPAVTVEALDRHLSLHMATMGVARMLSFPDAIRFRLPDAAAMDGPLDPRVQAIDPARNMLHIYTVLLTHWQRRDFGALVADVVRG